MVEDPKHVQKHLARNPGDPAVGLTLSVRSARSTGKYNRDERQWEVGQAHSTEEGREYQQDAEEFHGALQERLKEFNLELSEEKTRLINFGRFAAKDREKRGEGKPETFDFLGFTHICSTTRHGVFCVRRKTMAKKKRAKLADLTKEFRKRMHRSIAENGRWLRTVLEGHYRYYGVPRNYRSLAAFRQDLLRIWRRILRRRGDKKKKVTWMWMEQLAERWLPKPRIVHPYPNERFTVGTRGRSPVR